MDAPPIDAMIDSIMCFWDLLRCLFFISERRDRRCKFKNSHGFSSLLLLTTDIGNQNFFSTLIGYHSLAL